jgi:serine-type D-Ala-D-Ala carboxypeptidase/endopeptidase
MNPADIQALLTRRLALTCSGTGMVVGLADHLGNTQFVCVGSSGAGRGAVSQHMVFELGSITKAITGSLLAQMAAQGLLSEQDPLSRWLPALAGRAAGRISLGQLATHTSGLPRLPTDLGFTQSAFLHRRNPYAHYSAEQLLAFVQAWPGNASTQTKPPAYAYSNLGFALLGMALERAGQMPFAQLLLEKIVQPAGASLAHMRAHQVPAPQRVQGHDLAGWQTPAWEMQAFEAAGALCANAADTLQLVRAASQQQAPFAHGAQHWRVARSKESESAEQKGSGLGWLRTHAQGDRLVWHNGGTGGCRSFAGYSESSGRCVVVLVNGVNEVTDIGLHLLNPRMALQEPGLVAPGGKQGLVFSLMPLLMAVPLWRWARHAQQASPAKPGWPSKPMQGRLPVFLDLVSYSLLVASLWRLGYGLHGYGTNWVALAYTVGGVALAALALWRTRHWPLVQQSKGASQSLVWATLGTLACACVALWAYV